MSSPKPMSRPKTLAQVEAMEEEEEKGSMSVTSPGPRWNPTKEQIVLLEGLYRQGIRTPSADQIQQITAKLREFGSIEGKNVFYWFQNHKARQRQKQKQENFAYYSRLVHHQPPPLLPPPPPTISPQASTNVVYNPFCLPVAQLGGSGYYHPQFPHIFLPTGAANWVPKPEPQMPETAVNNCRFGATGDRIRCTRANETLQLFPLHPTNMFEERSGSSLTSASAGSESMDNGGGGGGEDGNESLPFYDIFGEGQA